MKLQKGQIIELKIEKIVYGGEGLGYYNNEFAMFVPMSVPGDILKVEIISLKKTYGRALIKSIISPGEERISDLNRLTFEDFQGCDFGMLNYESQLKYKRDMVEDVVRRIGKNSIVNIEETLGSPVESNYRNKVKETFSVNGNEIITGIFKRKSHDVFQVEDNMLNSILGNKIISKLKDILNKKKISVYDEKRHKGLLRHVMVRTNSFNEAMLVLIINDTKISENIKEILKEVMDNFKEVVSVYVSLNDRKTNVALGNKNILICGEKTIKEDISGIHFNISPTSFFQINL